MSGSPSTRELQHFAAQRLGGESAACVVMDVTTAMSWRLSSTPGFDPNWFNVGITGPQWRDLTTDDHKPLLNKAIAAPIRPARPSRPRWRWRRWTTGMARRIIVVNCTGSISSATTLSIAMRGGSAAMATST